MLFKSKDFWNGALFPTVRPSVHTNPSRKRSFSKTLLKPEKFENAEALRFSVEETILKTGDFQKWWRYDAFNGFRSFNSSVDQEMYSLILFFPDLSIQTDK